MAIDLDRLGAWMDEQGLPGGPITDLEPLEGGTQNVLLRFRRGPRSYVLRRPPVHPRPRNDETMRREARVLGALAGSDVPHPALIASCPDPDVLGVAFYLMEPVEGFNPTRGLPELHRSDPAVRRRMGLAMAEAIASLARLDAIALGLADLGRPEGFLERQVERWRSQLESYRELPGYERSELPGVEDVGLWLERNRPRQSRTGILHGDFHLANVLFSPRGPELLAVVDWELTTIGDPLLDLGWLLATWPEPGRASALVAVLKPWEGFPTAADLVARYRELSDRDLSAIEWYAVLACYKLGIVLEGTHARARAGRADRAIGDALHAVALGLLEQARERMRRA